MKAKSRLLLWLPALAFAGLSAAFGPGAFAADEPPAAPAAPAADAQQAKPVKLRWSAKDGDQVYGYLVYRSESRQGPYLRISEKILRTPQDGAPQHHYELEDSRVEVGATYFYYIDGVNKSGFKVRFSGVLPKKVEAAAPDPTDR